MPTLPEQLEALTVLDKLKEREENPLSKGGDWTKASGASTIGKVTSTGWTTTADKTQAGAVWAADTWDSRVETGVGITIAALPAINQYVTFGFTGADSPAAAIGKETSNWLVYFFIGEIEIGNAKPAAEAGDRFFIVSRSNRAALYRKPGGGGEIEELLSAEGEEIGEAKDTTTIGFSPEGVSGTAVRVTDFAVEVIGEPPTAPENTAAPTVSGTAVVGDTLSSDTGEWSGEVSKYRYMWQIATGSGWLDLYDYWTLSGEEAGEELELPAFTAGRKVRCGVRAEGPGGSTDAFSEPVTVAGTATAALAFDGDEISKFRTPEEGAEDRISEVADPLGSGDTVFKFTVEDGDVYPLTSTENPRAKLPGPPWLIEGSEVWFKNAFLVPSEEDCPAIVDVEESPGWMLLLDIWGPPYEGDASWKVSLGNKGDIRFQRNESYGDDVPFSIPIVRNKWVEVITHMVFSESGGYVEMWVNGEQVTFFTPGQKLVYNPNEEPESTKLEMATRDFSVEDGPVGPNISQYRKAGMFEEATVYFKPLEMWLDFNPDTLVPPVNTVAPAITGTAQVGKTLNCSTGTWEGEPESYAYQWQRSATGEGGWSDIGSATSASYKVAKTYEGEYLRCEVTATNEAGLTEAASMATAEVEAMVIHVEPEPPIAVPALPFVSRLDVTWRLFLCDSESMELIGEIKQARGRQFQLAKNKPGGCSFDVPLDSDQFGGIEEVKYGIVAYRDEEPRYSGMIWNLDEKTDGNSLAVQSVGWFETLNHRILRENLGYPPFNTGSITGGEIVFAPAQGTIGATDFHPGGLLTIANAQRDTWIVEGTSTDEMQRIISYQRGQNIGSAITQLSEIEAGFDWDIDVLTRVIDINNWDSVPDKTEEVVFGFNWGPCNIDILGRQFDVSTMANRVTALGKFGGGFAEDVESQNDFQLFEEQAQLSDVIDPNVMLAYAGSEVLLRKQPRVLYSFQPFPYSANGSVPAPFKDYDLGDLISFTAIKKPRIVIHDQAVRVYGINVSVTDEGNEKVTALQISP